MSRRAVTFGAAALLSSRHGLTPAAAQDWPVRPVKFVVPVPGGTATDLTARIYGDKLAAIWRQSVVVENKPGADGLVALGSFAAAHDDHALMFSFSTAVSINPLVYSKLPYDAGVDLVPITTTAEVMFLIAVSSAVQARTMAELVAQARATPGKLSWAASPGLPRFVFERFRRDLGLDMTYVGYTQPSGGVIDLGEGRIQVMIISLNTVLPVITTGKARVLAIASTDRIAAMPAVPHVVEAGFPTLAVPGIGCVYGAKGMSTELRDRIARDFDGVAQNPSVADQLATVGQIVRRSNPADLAAMLVAQRTTLAPLAAIMAAAQ